jgi:cytochrome c-type biogenesis protein
MQEVEREDGLRRRVLQSCVGFCLGFSTVFIVLGASASMLGRVLRTWNHEVFGYQFGISQIAGLVIIVMGLHIAGLLPIRALYRERRWHLELKGSSVLGSYLVGGAFAFGWSPCVGPILGGILTIAGSRETIGQGVGLLAVYSAGLAVPFLLAGYSIGFFFRTFQRVKHHFRTLELASGGLLVAVGVLVLTDRLTSLNNYFAFMTKIVTAAERHLLN